MIYTAPVVVGELCSGGPPSLIADDQNTLIRATGDRNNLGLTNEQMKYLGLVTGDRNNLGLIARDQNIPLGAIGDDRAIGDDLGISAGDQSSLGLSQREQNNLNYGPEDQFGHHADHRIVPILDFSDRNNFVPGIGNNQRVGSEGGQNNVGPLDRGNVRLGPGHQTNTGPNVGDRGRISSSISSITPCFRNTLNPISRDRNSRGSVADDRITLGSIAPGDQNNFGFTTGGWNSLGLVGGNDPLPQAAERKQLGIMVPGDRNNTDGPTGEFNRVEAMLSSRRIQMDAATYGSSSSSQVLPSNLTNNINSLSSFPVGSLSSFQPIPVVNDNWLAKQQQQPAGHHILGSQQGGSVANRSISTAVTAERLYAPDCVRPNKDNRHKRKSTVS